MISDIFRTWALDDLDLQLVRRHVTSEVLEFLGRNFGHFSEFDLG